MSNTRIYRIWIGIKKRCYCKTARGYFGYGGRGITMCDEWLHDFEAFYKWAMANGYADNLTIERIDVNGNYEPSNCKWITKEEQASNRRTNHKLLYNGEIKTVAQISRETGISEQTIRNRIKSKNFSNDEILKKPIQHSHNVEYNGEIKSLRQWSISTGISYETLRHRIVDLNWDIEKALTTKSG